MILAHHDGAEEDAEDAEEPTVVAEATLEEVGNKGETKEYTVDEIKMFGDVDIKETITFNYSNGVKGVCHVDGSSTISLVVSIAGDKGSIWIDMVNCPNVIIVKSKKGLIKKIYLTKPKYGGFEYELIACKNAIQLGKKETEEWNHQNIISFAKIIEEILNERREISLA